MSEQIKNLTVNTDRQGEKTKIKTTYAQIVVGGRVEKPYFSILYYDPSDNEYHLGFGSYYLEYVFKWLKEEFEIVNYDTSMSPDLKWNLVIDALPEDVDISEHTDFIKDWVVGKRLSLQQISERLEIVEGLFTSNSVLVLAAQLFGMKPKRLADLMSLYKDGGIPLAPMNVGDKVWRICWDKVAKEWVVDDTPTFVSEVGTRVFFVSYTNFDPEDLEEPIPFDEIGNTCFLSREEAVAAAAVKAPSEQESEVEEDEKK